MHGKNIFQGRNIIPYPIITLYNKNFQVGKTRIIHLSGQLIEIIAASVALKFQSSRRRIGLLISSQGVVGSGIRRDRLQSRSLVSNLVGDRWR